MVTKERIVTGLCDYVRLDLLPAMPDGIAKFGASMMLSAFRVNPDKFLEQVMPFLKIVGIVTEDGSFDVDAFSTYARDAIKDSRIVKVAGFTLDTDDINRLIGRLQ